LPGLNGGGAAAAVPPNLAHNQKSKYIAKKVKQKAYSAHLVRSKSKIREGSPNGT